MSWRKHHHSVWAWTTQGTFLSGKKEFSIKWISLSLWLQAHLVKRWKTTILMEDMPQLVLVKHQLPHFCQNSREKNQCLICKQKMHSKRQEIAQSMLVKIEKWPRLWEEGPIMHKSSLLISLMRWEDLLLPSVLMMVISWSLIRRFNSKPISVRKKRLFLKTANKKTTQCAQALTKRMKIRNQILKKL